MDCISYQRLRSGLPPNRFGGWRGPATGVARRGSARSIGLRRQKQHRTRRKDNLMNQATWKALVEHHDRVSRTFTPRKAEAGFRRNLEAVLKQDSRT